MTTNDKKRGGRERTGTVVPLSGGRLQAIITLADGSRKRMRPFPKGTSEAYAKDKAKFWSEEAIRRGLVAPPKKGKVDPSSGEAWWTSYLEFREARGLSTVQHLYGPHIAPVVTTHPKDWTRADCERLVTALDAKIASTGDDRISWKTAANVWSLFTKACKVASSAKAAAGLRVRGDNPCTDVEGPERGENLLKQWLHPSEFTALVTCADVPFRWRRLYALLAYTYVRPGELRALDWLDVDLDVGTIHITKAWDEKRGRLKAPKTAAGVRHVPIEPTLLPLLKAMRDECGGTGPVVQAMPPKEDWAAKFRLHLEKRAKVNRPELYVTTATHKRITLYDLRATGITWRCLRKDYGPEIQQAAGHEKYDTTDGYIRTARVFVGRVGEPFPPLPASLNRSPNRSVTTQVFDIAATPPGIEPGLPA